MVLQDRRRFLTTGLAAVSAARIPGFWTFPRPSRPSRSDRLAIAVIGCGGKGLSDLLGVAQGNDVVALCDVDEQRAAKAFSLYPSVPKYRDFRVMLDRERRLDAVVISTPDHTHAVAAAMAMRRGLHVYVQKPLTHDIVESRALQVLARRTGVATSMGNQGTAMNGFREAVEVVRSGAIGEVREVHCWTNRPIWPQGLPRPDKVQAIPRTLRWDLWLGPAPYRPYHSSYCPFRWRGWWDFGTGALGDMGCHVANLAFMALRLGHPLRVAAESGGMTAESPPKWSIVRYDFPARVGRPPVRLTWYDGGKLPPERVRAGIGKLPTNGSLLVGSKGTLFCGDAYGRKYRLLPEEAFADYEPPEPSLPRTDSIYHEWLAACRGGRPALAGFDYACLLNETILLGNVAIRAGEPIEWDGPAMRVKNHAAANAWLGREYRYGYSLEM